MSKLEEARKAFEEIAKECGVDIDELYKATQEKNEQFNFKDKEEANEVKAEIVKALKETKQSILFAGDGHTIMYGSPVTVLSSLCCIINRLREDMPIEVLKQSIDLVLGDE